MSVQPVEDPCLGGDLHTVDRHPTLCALHDVSCGGLAKRAPDELCEAELLGETPTRGPSPEHSKRHSD
jgi:hypothetical protein